MKHVDNQILEGFFIDVQRYTANFLIENTLQRIVIKLDDEVSRKIMRGLLDYSFEFIPSTEDDFIQISLGSYYLNAQYVEQGGEFTFEDFKKMLYRNAYLDDLDVKETSKKALFKQSLDYGFAYLRLSK